MTSYAFAQTKSLNSSGVMSLSALAAQPASFLRLDIRDGLPAHPVACVQLRHGRTPAFFQGLKHWCSAAGVGDALHCYGEDQTDHPVQQEAYQAAPRTQEGKAARATRHPWWHRNDNPDPQADKGVEETVLIKGRKRRWRSGTVAIREIRRQSRSTKSIFPKASFSRLVREITQDFSSDTRYTKSGLAAIHEAAEQFVVERFMKADLARRHAGRKTLHINDVKFSDFMTHKTSELVGNGIQG